MVWLDVVASAPTALGAMAFLLWVVVLYRRTHEGFGVVEDWLPLLIGAVGLGAGLPLAYMLDQGIVNGSGLRTFLVVVLVPAMVLGFGWSSVQSVRLGARMKQLFDRIEIHLLEPEASVRSKERDDLERLSTDVDELMQLMERRIRPPRESEFFRRDLERLAMALTRIQPRVRSGHRRSDIG